MRVHLSPAPVLAAVLAGCGSAPPPPLEPPALATAVSHFRGGLLAGPADPALIPPPAAAGDRRTLDELAPAELLVVRCSILYLERVPTVLAPLPSRARLIVGARGDRALLPTVMLAPGARVGRGDRQSVLETPAAQTRVEPVTRLAGLLPPRTTILFTATAPEAVLLDSGVPLLRQLGLFVSRSADDDAALEVSLLIEDSPAGGAEVDPLADPVQRQLMVLDDAPAPGAAPLALLCHSPFSGTEGAGFAVFVDVERASADLPDLERMIADCTRDLETNATEAIQRALRVGSTESRARSLGSGLALLTGDAPPRATLVFVAGAAGAQFGLDLALAADEATLQAWVERFHADTELLAELDAATLRDIDAQRLEQIGWELERSAYALLAEELDRGSLSPALYGLLLAHAGDVARSAPALRGALQRAEDVESLAAEFAVENRAFLHSADPAERVRAHDWLLARGLEVPGYAPLDDREARHAALTAPRKPADAAGTADDTEAER